MSRATSIAVLIALGAVLGTAPVVRAEVPAAQDFATCHANAADETRTASRGSGRPDDAPRAAPAAGPRPDVKVTKPGGAPRDPVDPPGETLTPARAPARRREAQAAGEGAHLARHAAPCAARLRRGAHAPPSQALRPPCACDTTGAQAGAEANGLFESAVAAGAPERAAPQGGVRKEQRM